MKVELTGDDLTLERFEQVVLGRVPVAVAARAQIGRAHV